MASVIGFKVSFNLTETLALTFLSRTLLFPDRIVLSLLLLVGEFSGDIV
jgi:hypothetical protein